MSFLHGVIGNLQKHNAEVAGLMSEYENESVAFVKQKLQEGTRAESEAAANVLRRPKQHNDEVNSLAKEYENESVAFVKRKFQEGTLVEKMAAAKALK